MIRITARDPDWLGDPDDDNDEDGTMGFNDPSIWQPSDDDDDNDDNLSILDILDKKHASEYPGSYRAVLHQESLGSQLEFFDDHQKWMIESFDDL